MKPDLIRDHSVSYVELSIQLHGCVADPEILVKELDTWLRNRLPHDYDSDIEVERVEYPPLHPEGV